MVNPEGGEVIQGTGGLRKLRFSDTRRSKGKRGGLRVIPLPLGERPRVLVVHIVRQGRDGRFDAQAARGIEGAHQERAEDEEEDMRKKRNLFDD